VGDHRLGQMVNFQHHGGAGVEQHLARALVGLAHHFLEVMARRKGFARARYHHHAHGSIVRKLIQCVAEGGDHRFGQGVELFGAVERQPCNMFAVFAQHQRVVFGCGVCGRGGHGRRFHLYAYESCRHVRLFRFGCLERANFIDVGVPKCHNKQGI